MLKSLSPKTRKRTVRVLLALGTVYAAVLGYNYFKPLPAGISVAGPLRTAGDFEFLYDLSFQREDAPATEHRIFDRVFAMIDGAEEFVVLDMFLFNDEHGGERLYRPLSGELTDRLIRRKEEVPDLRVTFITDEINNFYGAYKSAEFRRLREAGIQVLTTQMTRLRDSNPGYSAGWRILAGWLGTGGPGWLPNFLSSTGRKVTARSYLKLLNFKANHRKLLVTDQGCLVTSANPHDASSFHSNIAFAGTGDICRDLLESERAVAAFSGGGVEAWPVFNGASRQGAATPLSGPGAGVPEDGRPASGLTTSREDRVQLVTEGKILQALLRDLAAAGDGHRIDLAMFYLSDRRVVGALLDAADRGARVHLVLDPNKDAFGHRKRGVPNRQTAGELIGKSGGRIAVRWYETDGEQFHTKLVLVTRGEAVTVMGGSANLTRRNIGDFNLETDLRFELHRDSPLASAVSEYFQRIWENRDGEYTAPFERYRDDSLVRAVRYRIQEATGFSSF